MICLLVVLVVDIISEVKAEFVVNAIAANRSKFWVLQVFYIYSSRSKLRHLIVKGMWGRTKDTRIARCLTPYDFLAHEFFAMAPGSLEFLFESERAESATSNSSFLRIQ